MGDGVALSSMFTWVTVPFFIIMICAYSSTTIVGVNAFQSTPPPIRSTTMSTIRRASIIQEMAPNPSDEALLSSLPSIVTSKLSSYESLLEFNSQFKQGLKYVLVPNAPTNRNVKPSYYYDVTIPETLDAPIPNSMMDYTSPATFVPAAKVDATSTFSSANMVNMPSIDLQSIEFPQLNLEAPKIQLPQINLDSVNSPTNFLQNLPTNMMQLPTVPSSDLHVVVNTDRIDAMGRDVDRVLQAARSMVSSSIEVASNSPILDVAIKANTQISSAATVANKQIIDPVVDRTIEQMKFALSHPPDYTGYTFTGGAPPGQGLATPVIDAISTAIQKARETPPLYYADPLPNDYTTIPGGFQAKITAIETANKIQNSIYDTAQQIAANNALMQQEAKKVLAAELEQMQARNTIIAEKASERAQSNLQYLHQLQDVVSNQIVTNAHSIQEQFHFNELKASVEQNIIKALAVNDVYQSDQIRKMITSLKIDEYGGYYVGAILGVALLQWMQNEKQITVQKFTDKLSIDTQIQLEQVVMEKQKLETMVMELTEAVSLLTNELQILKSQRVQTDTVLASVVNNQQSVLSEENEMLRNQIESMKVELLSLQKQKGTLTTNTSASLMPRPPQNPPPIATTKRMETDVESIQNAFFAATVTSKDMNKSVPGRATSSLTTTTNTGTGASGKRTTTDVNNDWSKLPFTAIKRKPITEIIAYLQARGCDVIGADGKPLSKSQLIEAIFSF